MLTENYFFIKYSDTPHTTNNLPFTKVLIQY